MNLGPLGWIEDRDAVEAVCVALEAEGYRACTADSRPDLIGFAKREIARGIFAVTAGGYERMARGQNLDPYLQRRGVCTGCGTTRAVQDTWYAAIAFLGEVGSQNIELSIAPTYAGARVEIRKGALGFGDGAVVADAALYMVRFGAVPKGVYGQYDLTGFGENYAVEWGAPGRGVPDIVQQAGIKVRAHRCRNASEIADCCYARKFVSFGSNLIWGDRDSSGMSRPDSRGGHCIELCGAFARPNSEPGIIGQQSWGRNNPGGPTQLVTAGGGRIELRDGSFGMYLEDIDRGLQGGGEAWAFDIIPGEGFR